MKDGKDVNTETVLDAWTTLSGEVLEPLLSRKDVARYLLEACCSLYLRSSFLAGKCTQQQHNITVKLKKIYSLPSCRATGISTTQGKKLSGYIFRKATYMFLEPSGSASLGHDAARALETCWCVWEWACKTAGAWQTQKERKSQQQSLSMLLL